jgi:O-antigen/teichoic acid export membrane protein
VIDANHIAPRVRTPASTVPVTHRRITLATAANLSGRLVGVALGIAVAAILARALGVGSFGRLSVAFALVGLAGNAGDFGLSQIAVREMAADPDRRAEILGSMVAVRLVLSTVLTAAVVGAVFLILPAGSARWMGLLVALTIPLGALSALQTGAQARLRAEVMTYVSLGQSLVWLALVAALALFHAPLAAYGAGFLVSGLVQGGLAWAFVRPISAVAWRPRWESIRPLLRSSLPLGLAGLCVTAYYKLDGVILYQLKGSEQTALYAAAYRFLDVLQLFPATVLAVLLPLLASYGRTANPERSARAMRAALVLLGVVAIPIVVGGVLLSDRIVVLLYGREFQGAGPLLAILLPAFLSICLGYVFTASLITADRVWPYAAVAVGAAALNIAANLILIPHFGAKGAAWITLATEFPVMSAITLLARRHTPVALPWSRWVRAGLAAAFMGLSVVALSSQPLVLVIVVAAAVYVGAAVVGGAIRTEDLRQLMNRVEATAA